MSLVLALVAVVCYAAATSAADENVTAVNEGTPAALASADASIKAVAAGSMTIDSLKAELETKYAAGGLKKAGLEKLLTVAYNRQRLTRANVQWLLGQLYADGKLAREDLRWIITQAYTSGELRRDDVRFVLGEMYKGGQLTREDLRWLIVQSYKAGELNRDDLRWLITHAYNQNELTRDDMKWLIVESYKAGELKLDDVREILVAAYNSGELTRGDLRWLIVQSYKAGELTRDNVRQLLTASYNHGQLTRADLKWLLVESYKAGELTLQDVKELLTAAYAKGELRGSDVEWIVEESYRLGEIKESELPITDIMTTAVEATPAAAPSLASLNRAAIAVSEENAPVINADGLVNTSEAFVLYRFALVQVEKARIGMEALIGFAEAQGANDTSGLVALRDALASEKDQLGAAIDGSDIPLARRIISSMRGTVSSFRTELGSVVTNHTGARAAVDVALSNNEEYLDSLVTDARTAQRDRNIELFDLAVARAQARIDFANTIGWNVSGLQAKLDGIRDMRSPLLDAMNSAIEACTGEGIGKCTSGQVPQYIAIRNDIVRGFKDLLDLGRASIICNRVRNALNTADTTISALEKRPAAAALLPQIKDKVSTARVRYDRGDCSGAADDLNSALNVIKSARAAAGGGGGIK